MKSRFRRWLQSGRPAADLSGGKAPVSAVPARPAAAPAEPAVDSETAILTEPQEMEVKQPEPEMPQELSVEDVLSLLVQCSKSEKHMAEEGLRAIEAGPMMDRYTASLRQLELKAAGRDVLLFTASEAGVHMVSEEAFNRQQTAFGGTLPCAEHHSVPLCIIHLFRCYIPLRRGTLVRQLSLSCKR